MTTPPETHTFDQIVTNVRNFIAQSEDYLSNSSTRPADSTFLLECIPTKSISRMSYGTDLDGPYVAATINHKSPRTPRLFDPGYMAVLLTLELSGGRIRFHSNRNECDPSKHYYVVFSAPRKERGLVRVLRVIADTNADVRTGQLPREHREYRRAALEKLDWDRHGSRPTKGREDAIQLALALFTQSERPISPAEYEMLLRSALSVADRLHAKAAKNSQGSDFTHDSQLINDLAPLKTYPLPPESP